MEERETNGGDRELSPLRMTYRLLARAKGPRRRKERNGKRKKGEQRRKIGLEGQRLGHVHLDVSGTWSGTVCDSCSDDQSFHFLYTFLSLKCFVFLTELFNRF